MRAIVAGALSWRAKGAIQQTAREAAPILLNKNRM
jgi:hypothetical protein